MAQSRRVHSCRDGKLLPSLFFFFFPRAQLSTPLGKWQSWLAILALGTNRPLQGGAVGLGNVLRYPSVVFANSGLQWPIPYLIALFFLGIPVLLLEISLGQAYRASVVTSFNSMHNRAKGVGLSVVLTGYMIVCYYVPILSWVMHYFRSSFQSLLPWAGRGEDFYMGDVIANEDPVPGVVDGGRVVQYASYPG